MKLQDSYKYLKISSKNRYKIYEKQILINDSYLIKYDQLIFSDFSVKVTING